MLNRLTIGVLVFALAFAAQASSLKYDGLAATPPMGWNSWNAFGCNVDEKMLREMADAMVDSGLRDAGYTYLNIDDCWHGLRDEQGRIHEDSERFPSGMKALADYVHGKGLKIGIYSDAGTKTCGGRPGSKGHELQDAQTYAEWGIDYLKYDWCNTEGMDAPTAYRTMGRSLVAAKRPVVFSLCEWGSSAPWNWGGKVGHLWRTTGDIAPCFDCVEDHGDWKRSGVVQILDMQTDDMRRKAGPEHWNDPDMLQVGNGLSDGENRAHFTLWAMLAAPLMAGNDLQRMMPDTRKVLTQRDVIAIDQDVDGIQGYRHARRGDLEVWVRPLADGAWAVAFLNRSQKESALKFDWRAEAIADALSGRKLDLSVGYSLRELWSGQDAGTTAAPLAVSVPGHDIAVYRLAPMANGR